MTSLKSLQIQLRCKLEFSWALGRGWDPVGGRLSEFVLLRQFMGNKTKQRPKSGLWMSHGIKPMVMRFHPLKCMDVAWYKAHGHEVSPLKVPGCVVGGSKPEAAELIARLGDL